MTASTERITTPFTAASTATLLWQVSVDTLAS